MTHRAEAIMVALVTTCTGLATTGANVFRGLAYPVQGSELPALLIHQGDDEIAEESMFHRVASRLTVNIDAVAQEVSAQIDETLNTIRKEIAAAIGAAPNLGLGFEVGALEQQAEQPEITGDGDRPTGRMRLVWTIDYRRDRADPAN